MIKEKGTIKVIGEVVSGRSQKGNDWARQDIVLEIPTSFSTFRHLALRADSRRVEDIAKLRVGQEVEVSYIVSSREWNGKWFADVDLIDIRPTAVQNVAPQNAAPAYAPQNPAPQRAPQAPAYPQPQYSAPSDDFPF